MRAILFTGRNEVACTTLPDPKPGAGEVVVDIRSSGICHTDLEVLRANYGTSAFPLVPGHEFAGVIVETGAGVEDLSVGDRVVVDPNLECGSCPACRRGWAHLCENLGAYGVTCNGGFAERSVVKASAVHGIGDMPFEIAALAEPVGCVLNGLQAARSERAGNALIFGAGPIGLLLAFVLRSSGVSDVILVDRNDARCALADSLGFRAFASGGAELKSWLAGADLAVDATGVPAVAQDLVRYIANGGTGLFFGVCPSDARIEIAPFELFRRQITLAGSHSLNHNIPAALKTLAACDERVAQLVTHRLPLDSIAAHFSGEAISGSLKVQFAGS